MVPGHKRYQTSLEYHSCHLIYKWQRQDDDVASEMGKMQKKATIEMRVKVFKGKYLIYAINVLSKFKQTRDFLRTHKGAEV